LALLFLPQKTITIEVFFDFTGYVTAIAHSGIAISPWPD
jgi:hypothetical protein